MELINRVRTGKFFHCYLNPEREVSPEAVKVHGLTYSFLKDKPLFAHMAQEFLEFIADSHLIIHNANFDLGFINTELELLGHKHVEAKRVIDTLMLARKKYPGHPASLDALCKRFNINLEARQKNGHGALLDAELLVGVYLNLIGANQSILLDTAIHAVNNNVQVGSVVRKTRPIRSFNASDADIEAHEEFLKKVKNPIWKEG